MKMISVKQIFITWIICLFLFTHVACSVEPLIQSETQLEHGVEVVSVKGDWSYQVVTARVPYIGIEGDEKTGLARVVIPVRKLKENKKLPAFCHVHYEKDIAGAKKWAEKGWIVSTAVYTPADGESPIDAALGNGYNLARAIIQWIKRLPIVDISHILIDGGSQGGYMALAMSADLFPIVATHADVPVVNWAYNFAYFEANRAISGFGKPAEQSPMPVLASVTGLADMCYRYFSNDLNQECWYYLSPISYLNLITNPVMITCATGDMLVPIEQMTRKYVREYDPQQFPNGFTRDFDKLSFCPLAKKVFEEFIPEDNYEIFLLQPQENSCKITQEMSSNNKLKPKSGSTTEDKPWSKIKQWSLVYLDEGGPSPVAGHTKLEWKLSPESFVDNFRSAPLPISVLTLDKLEHLLRRYSGEVEKTILLNNGNPAKRLNYSNIEQQDVLISLSKYSQISEEHYKHLQKLYEQSSIKPFGSSIGKSLLKIIN